jgi:hypothetical protein
MKIYFIKHIIAIFLFFVLWSCNLDSPLTYDNKTPIIKNETKWKISNSDETKLYKIYLKEYLSDGKLSILTEYLQSGSIKSIAQFTYQNNISYEETKYFNGDFFIDSILQNIYIHNTSGKIERKISLTRDGDTSFIIDYSYDQKGNLIKKIQTDLISNNSIVTDIQYQYNNNGNVVGRLINPSLNGTYESRDSIAYQSEGIKVELYNYNQEGKINVIYTYFYNKFGYIYKEFHSSKEAQIIGKYEYDYSYWN